MGFSRLVSFDGAAAILVCKSECDLGRVSKPFFSNRSDTSTIFTDLGSFSTSIPIPILWRHHPRLFWYYHLHFVYVLNKIKTHSPSNSVSTLTLWYFLQAQCNSTYTNGKILVFGTKTAFKYSSEHSSEQYRKGSKQPIFLASIDVFKETSYRVFGIVSAHPYQTTTPDRLKRLLFTLQIENTRRWWTCTTL